MNSQKVQTVTKLHARDLLSLSLQLPPPKAEEAEGTTKNSAKPANIQTADIRHGVNNKDEYYLRRLRNFRQFF